MNLAPARIALRRTLVRAKARHDPRLQAWTPVPEEQLGSYVALCNVCGWHGDAFEGIAHSERATCPSCGSIARDRFLHHCFQTRVRYRRDLRVQSAHCPGFSFVAASIFFRRSTKNGAHFMMRFSCYTVSGRFLAM